MLSFYTYLQPSENEADITSQQLDSGWNNPKIFDNFRVWIVFSFIGSYWRSGCLGNRTDATCCCWSEDENSPPPCELFPGEAPQVRSTPSPWTPGSSGYPARDAGGFVLLVILCVHISVCVCTWTSVTLIFVFCTLRIMSGLEASAGRDNTSPLMVWVWRRYLR